MLVYKDMSFLQVLEGNEGDIREIYDTIHEDPRHHRIKVLFETEVAHREFGEWAMGFYQPHADEFEFMPSYSDFMQSGLIRTPACFERI